MEVKIIEAKNNEIRLVEDILLIYVKDINLLRNMNKEQLVEFMFNENEIVKSLSFVREFKDSIRNCVFDIISVNELRDLIESKEVPLYSLIISTATYYKKIYLASKRNAIDEVSIECSKENFVNVISLVNNETRNVTIKCHDISLKEYSELLKDINVSNKNIKVDYQEANTPIKLNTLHDLSLFIGNIVSYINKYNLSELEKIMYVYDIVKYRIYNKDEDNYLNNRDLDKVTSGNTIVCSGFSNLFNAILMSLDIKAMPLISKTAKHQRSIVYVNDSKYDIDGIYVFDPTWDCRKKESENYYLERYNYFMMPLSRSKITAYDEISRLLEVNVKDIINTGYEDYVADAIYCNDRSVYEGTGIGTTETTYMPGNRLLSSTPTLKCVNKNDRFTKSTTLGNGKLTKKVGVVTVDEVMYSGATSSESNAYYLYEILNDSSNGSWTMSPMAFSNGGIYSPCVLNGAIYVNPDICYFTSNYAVPVISIKGDAIISGTGTSNNPFKVE